MKNLLLAAILFVNQSIWSNEIENLSKENLISNFNFVINKTATISKPLEVVAVDYSGNEELLSCRHFLARVELFKPAQEETNAIYNSIGREFNSNSIDFVQNRNYSFFRYPELSRDLKFQFRAQFSKAEVEIFKSSVKTFKAPSYNVVNIYPTFAYDIFSNEKYIDNYFYFDIALTQQDLCDNQGVSLSYFSNCKAAHYGILDCNMFDKTSYYSGSLRKYHPKMKQFKKNRSSELGLDEVEL